VVVSSVEARDRELKCVPDARTASSKFSCARWSLPHAFARSREPRMRALLQRAATARRMVCQPALRASIGHARRSPLPRDGVWVEIAEDQCADGTRLSPILSSCPVRANELSCLQRRGRSRASSARLIDTGDSSCAKIQCCSPQSLPCRGCPARCFGRAPPRRRKPRGA